MPLPAGTRLGPYEVVAPLGAGGMGEVFRARDTRLGRDVALKILPAAFAADPDRLMRFEREARTLATLNHPHIAQIFGLEDAAAAPSPTGAPGGLVRALVMELVEGEDLSARIARGPLPLDEALPIARQVAEALEAAHEVGIVHRDLKPANIKVRGDGTVKVLDFGLAKAVDAHASSAAAAAMNSPTITSPAMTMQGVILGTAAYMSPEQAKGKPVDRRADIWAFGCVCYEMLAGQRAFRGEDVSDTLAAVLRGEPDWAALPPLPPSILALIKRTLERDPHRRVASISTARFILDEPLAAATTPAPPATNPAPATARRSRWLAAVGVAAVLSALSTWAMSRSVPGPAALPETLYAEIAPPPGVRAAFERGFALSPDGRWLAFTARDQPGQDLLWLRDMRTGASRAISGTIDAAFPFWSPDSQHVAFWSERRIKRMHVVEGIPQVVTDAPAAAIFFRGGTWLEDDTIVFTDSANLLSQVPASGGAAQRVSGLPAANAVARTLYPRGLAGSRALLAGFEFRDTARSGIYRIDLSRPEATTRLIESGINEWVTLSLGPRRLAWMTGPVLGVRSFDGTSMGQDASVAVATGLANSVGWTHATASADGERLILGMRQRTGTDLPAVWLRRDGTRLATSDVTTQAAIRLAPDGHRAAITRGNDVWVVDTQRQVSTRVTNTRESESQPIWSPDGRRLAYRQIGVPDLFVVDLETSRAERHADVLPATSFVGVDWAPDGRTLVFATPFGAAASNLELVLYDLVSRQSSRLTSSPFNEMHPRFSRDGRSVAYTSDETGTREVYVRALDSLASRRLSTAGGEFPMWRKDGRELVYVAPDGAFMSVTTRQVAKESAAPMRLFVTAPNRGIPDQARFDMTPDGERFLIVSEPGPAPLTLIEHWRPAAAPSTAPGPVK